MFGREANTILPEENNVQTYVDAWLLAIKWMYVCAVSSFQPNTQFAPEQRKAQFKSGFSFYTFELFTFFMDLDVNEYECVCEYEHMPLDKYGTVFWNSFFNAFLAAVIATDCHEVVRQNELTRSIEFSVYNTPYVSAMQSLVSKLSRHFCRMEKVKWQTRNENLSKHKCSMVPQTECYFTLIHAFTKLRLDVIYFGVRHNSFG